MPIRKLPIVWFFVGAVSRACAAIAVLLLTVDATSPAIPLRKNMSHERPPPTSDDAKQSARQLRLSNALIELLRARHLGKPEETLDLEIRAVLRVVCGVDVVDDRARGLLRALEWAT